ncbi:MAG: sigma-70 family RNA polymerase sigma factor, partial [Flavobacteriales bacterium]|nr:sigma-70 family RNA polymerase sigma factor [Flavobacteriales bacterium]
SLLYKMANEKFISEYRKDKNAKQYADSFKLQLIEETPETKMMYQETLSKYQSVLASLPESQRVVFLLSRSEGLTYKEIAERLDLSIKAIEKRMSQALTKLRHILQKH